MRAGRAVPRGRRREVLRPARGEGRPRVPAALVNPDDEVWWRRIVNTPKRGVGDTSVDKVDGVRAGCRASRSATRSTRAAAAGVTGKALGGIRDLLELMDEFEDRRRPAASRTTVEAILEQTGYLAELEAERSIEAQGRIENLQELVGVCREFDAGARRRRRLGPARHRRRRHRATTTAGEHRDPARASPRIQAFLEAISLVTDLDTEGDGRRAERGHADDAAHGQGARVPGRVPHRPGRRRVPARAQPRRSRRARRGTAPLLRRHHPRRERLYLCHAWSRMLFGATDYYPPSRFLAEIPEELVARARRGCASGRSGGRRRAPRPVVSAAISAGRGDDDVGTRPAQRRRAPPARGARSSSGCASATT